MILMQDVEGYQVGEKRYPRGAIITDERGVTHIDQSYALAYRESQETGQPIVTLGPNSTYDPKQRAYVRDDAS